MGLGALELIMEVEDTFNIHIEDADAEKLITAGDLYRYVTAKVGSRPLASCPSARAFHRVRTAIVDAGLMDRRDVRLHTDLAEWAHAIPQAWPFFLQSLNLHPLRPPLPEELHRLLKRLAIATSFAIVPLIIATFKQRPAPPALLLPMISLCVAWVALMRKLERRLPPACRTVRGFVHHFELALAPAADEALWTQLRQIIAEIACVDPATIGPETTFINDLDLG